MFNITWHQEALKELYKLDFFIAKIIFKKVEEMREDPFSKDVKRLKGQTSFRLRIGDYRVLFEIIGNILFIKKVGHRKNIYD